MPTFIEESERRLRGSNPTVNKADRPPFPCNSSGKPLSGGQPGATSESLTVPRDSSLAEKGRDRLRTVGVTVALVALALLGGCKPTEAEKAHDLAYLQELERRKWDGPCADESVLLATTAGSPDKHQCPNRLHRMKVQVATSPSHEEAAALVFCECDRGADGGSP